MNPTPKLNYWPAMIDLLAATLMVFLMVTYLQSTLNMDVETLKVRQRQERFVQLFEQEFAKERQEGKISIRQALNFLQITFSDRVLFQSGDYRLQAQGRGLLQRCADLLARAAATEYRLIQVEGHTDNQPLRRSGYPSNNWQLSAARAISVVELLANDGRIEPELFSANGYAWFRPVADNNTPVARALNRRIEIRLLFSEPKSPDQAAEVSELSPLTDLSGGPS